MPLKKRKKEKERKETMKFTQKGEDFTRERGGGSSRYEMYPEIADTWTGRKRELEGGSGGAQNSGSSGTRSQKRLNVPICPPPLRRRFILTLCPSAGHGVPYKRHTVSPPPIPRPPFHPENSVTRKKLTGLDAPLLLFHGRPIYFFPFLFFFLLFVNATTSLTFERNGKQSRYIQ